MNRIKKILAVILAMVLAMALAGCKKEEPVEADPNKPYAGTTITVFNWYDYIDEEVLDIFYEETGIKVEYANFTTCEEMYTKLVASPTSYDVIVPSDYIIERLINEDMLYAMDTASMPNYAGIMDWLKTPSYDPEGKYSVAYMWGTVGILYNTEKTGGEIDSWESLFDTKYKGNVFMMDSMRDTVAVGLIYTGHSLNDTDKEALYAARDALIEQKKSGVVKAYLVDETKDMMVGGEAALALVWSGDALYAMEKNEDLAYCVPKEGSNVWLDGMCIPAGSENKEAAMVFIDFMCRPDIAYRNQQYIYYSSPVQEVVDTMYTDEERANLTLNPTQDIIDRCEFFGDKSAYNELYEEVWMGVKQAQ